MKCISCGRSNTKNNPVIKDSDPYASEINDDETEVWECIECRQESANDI